jgi:hypothetical protein
MEASAGVVRQPEKRLSCKAFEDDAAEVTAGQCGGSRKSG